MAEKRELKVSAIKEGTVIDHLPCENAFRIVQVLELERFDNVMLIGLNLESRKMGQKSIIKVAGRFFTQAEIDKISLLAPDAVINIIKNYQVKEKIRPQIPDLIENIVRCANANCITNHDKVTSKFHVVERKPLKLRCHYCERTIREQDIALP